MKIVVILVLLALIVGGGFGGAGLLGMGPLAHLAKAEEKPAETAKAPAEPEARTVDVEMFGVPLIEGNSVRSRLFVNFSLQVDPQVGPEVAASLPRVQSAVLHDLMDYLPRHLENRSKPDREVVRQRMLKVSRKVTGKQAAIRAVVINAMFER